MARRWSRGSEGEAELTGAPAGMAPFNLDRQSPSVFRPLCALVRSLASPRGARLTRRWVSQRLANEPELRVFSQPGESPSRGGANHIVCDALAGDPESRALAMGAGHPQHWRCRRRRLLWWSHFMSLPIRIHHLQYRPHLPFLTICHSFSRHLGSILGSRRRTPRHERLARVMDPGSHHIAQPPPAKPN